MSELIANGILVLAALAIIGIVVIYAERWLSTLDNEDEEEENLDMYWMLKCPEEEYY